MVATLPAVLRSVRTDDRTGLLLYGDQMTEAMGRFADPGFFDLFSFPLIAGDPGTALDAPNSIVLSRRLAQRLFGSDDPMGQTLQLGDRGISGDFVVTGIADDVPYESSLKFDWVIPFVQREIQTAGLGAGETYLQIADAAGVESALAFDPDRYWEDAKLVIVPLFDKRLHPQLSGGKAMMGTLYIFGFVAGLVLLLACINYANPLVYPARLSVEGTLPSLHFGSVLRNNHLHNNAQIEVGVGADSDGATENVVVEGNTVENSDLGILVDAGCRNVRRRRNQTERCLVPLLDNRAR